MTLEFDATISAQCQLTMRSGQSVVLRSLHQALTYGGAPDLIPTKDLNDQVLANVMDQARSACARRRARPWLIPPPRRDFRCTPCDMQEWDQWEPEWLPNIWCIAELVGGSTTRAGGHDASQLVVVWFQNSFAPPIAPTVLEEILTIEWDQVAINVNLWDGSSS